MIYVFFLRGVNAGGHNRVKMADLCRHLETAGYKGIQSYIQSGNFVMSFEAREGESLQEELEAAISDYTGFSVPVFLISGADLQGILNTFPFGPDHPDSNGNKTYFTFTRYSGEQSHTEAVCGELKKFVSESEKLVYSEKGLWLFCPDGYGKTRVNNSQIEKKLKCTATTRNLKTLNKMADLAREIKINE